MPYSAHPPVFTRSPEERVNLYETSTRLTGKLHINIKEYMWNHSLVYCRDPGVTGLTLVPKRFVTIEATMK